jgi:methanethiol oxidase
VIPIPAEPADADDLSPLFKPFGAAPPLVTDIDLSVDVGWLYVSCWGTGELKQYDVSDPFHPRETASVRLGGIVRREPHPAAPDLPLSGAQWWTADGRDQPRRSTGVPRCTRAGFAARTDTPHRPVDTWK